MSYSASGAVLPEPSQLEGRTLGKYEYLGASSHFSESPEVAPASLPGIRQLARCGKARPDGQRRPDGDRGLHGYAESVQSVAKNSSTTKLYFQQRRSFVVHVNSTLVCDVPGQYHRYNVLAGLQPVQVECSVGGCPRVPVDRLNIADRVFHPRILGSTANQHLRVWQRAPCRRIPNQQIELPAGSKDQITVGVFLPRRQYPRRRILDRMD